jgi:hypothetical protein
LSAKDQIEKLDRLHPNKRAEWIPEVPLAIPHSSQTHSRNTLDMKPDEYLQVLKVERPQLFRRRLSIGHNPTQENSIPALEAVTEFARFIENYEIPKQIINYEEKVKRELEELTIFLQSPMEISQEPDPLEKLPRLISAPFYFAETSFDIATDVAAAVIRHGIYRPLILTALPLKLYINRKW